MSLVVNLALVFNNNILDGEAQFGCSAVVPAERLCLKRAAFQMGLMPFPLRGLSAHIL